MREFRINKHKNKEAHLNKQNHQTSTPFCSSYSSPFFSSTMRRPYMLSSYQVTASFYQISNQHRSRSHKCKSLYDRWLASGYIPTEYDKLNSTNIHKVQNRSEESSENEFLEIKMSLGNGDLISTKKIEFIKDIQNVDTIIWTKSFAKIVELKGWTDQQALDALKILIDLKFHDTILLNADYQEILERLRRHQYPKEHFGYYNEDCNNCNQCNFRFINDFYVDLEKRFEKLTICGELNQKDAKLRFEEFFFNNLCIYTRLEMARLKLQSSKDILDYVRSQETILQEESKKKDS